MSHNPKIGRWVVSLLVLVGLACIASGQSLEVMLALDTSPGTEQAVDLIRSRLFHAGERAGVVTFGNSGARLLQRLTTDHAALDTALQRAGIRIGATVGSVQVNSSVQADLVTAITQSCEELARSGSAGSTRAVIVLFGSDDPGLTRQVDTVKATLQGAHARLYAIVIDWPEPGRPDHNYAWLPGTDLPHYFRYRRVVWRQGDQQELGHQAHT